MRVTVFCRAPFFKRRPPWRWPLPRGFRHASPDRRFRAHNALYLTQPLPPSLPPQACWRCSARTSSWTTQPSTRTTPFRRHRASRRSASKPPTRRLAGWLASVVRGQFCICAPFSLFRSRRFHPSLAFAEGVGKDDRGTCTRWLSSYAGERRKREYGFTALLRGRSVWRRTCWDGRAVCLASPWATATLWRGNQHLLLSWVGARCCRFCGPPPTPPLRPCDPRLGSETTAARQHFLFFVSRNSRAFITGFQPPTVVCEIVSIWT